MKCRLLLVTLVLCCTVAKAQPGNSHAGFNSYTHAIPDSITRSAAALSAHIQSRYATQKEQLLALYGWVTTNIRYDTDSSYYFRHSVDHETGIAATLRRRKGVCENFAALFVELATRIGVPAYTVYGYPRSIHSKNSTGHAWCAVNLNSEWYLCDPTWDAELKGHFMYYLVNPEIFIRSHIPFDPLWQLLEKPVNYNGTAVKSKSILHYRDSVQAFLQLDSLQQYLAIDRRMKRAGANNHMITLWQSYNRMNIAIIAGEQDMQWFNTAVDGLNVATDLFNAFVQYRNNRFSPYKPDTEVMQMLTPIRRLIAESTSNLDKMGLVVENFQYDTQAIRKQLTSLLRKTEEQIEFLQKYIATGPLEREQLFYRQAQR